MDEEEKKKKPAHSPTEEPEWIGTGTSKASRSIGTSTDYGTYKDDLDRLANAQRNYQMAELKKARDSALNSLNEQEQSIKPAYQNARNQTSAASQSGARSFQEYLANRGLTNSGAAAQSEINRQSALQNNLGNINTAEANAYRDIANQRTKVNTDYANGLASANAAIQQQYLNNLLNYNEQQRQYVNNLKEQALGQYANDYQAYMNTLDPNSLEYLQVGARRANKIENANQNAYTYQNSMNNILNGNWSANDLIATGRTQEQAQRLFEENQALLQKQAQAEAEQLAYQRAQDEIANELKWRQLENDTLLNNAKIADYNSQIAKRARTGVTYSEPDTLDKIESDYQNGKITQKQAEARMDALGIVY